MPRHEILLSDNEYAVLVGESTGDGVGMLSRSDILKLSYWFDK